MPSDQLPAASHIPAAISASTSAVKEPPATLWQALKMIGPGIILAGTIVGSGELILTTAIGAKHGFAFLWLILFSCVIKVFVQIELGRYAIYSGLPTLSALKNVSQRAWIGNTLLVWWILMLFFTVFQLGGMTGGVGQSLHMAFPGVSDTFATWAGHFSAGFGEYVRGHVEMPWAFLTCLVTIAIIFNGSYRRIEGVTTVLVVGVTLITVAATLALFATEYAPKWSDIGGGLLGKIPPEGIADAFAVFGITGVGATELFYYPYWCIEKGYGKFVGPNDGSTEWNARAQGWIRVMHLDAWVSMVVFTLSTVAFYSMGAAVLHPQGMVPAGAKMIETLSQMYRGPFGDWTQILFLVGAGAVLFKTLYLACAANSRMVVDLLGAFQVSRVLTPEGRLKSIKLFCVLFPCIALGMYLVNRDPQYMVKLGGIAQAATLPMMAIVTLVFRYRKLEAKLKPSLLSDIFLWIATLAITIVAAYSVPDAIRRLLG